MSLEVCGECFLPVRLVDRCAGSLVLVVVSLLALARVKQRSARNVSASLVLRRRQSFWCTISQRSAHRSRGIIEGEGVGHPC